VKHSLGCYRSGRWPGSSRSCFDHPVADDAVSDEIGSWSPPLPQERASRGPLA
jgi:hypothetical protein